MTLRESIYHIVYEFGGCEPEHASEAEEQTDRIITLFRNALLGDKAIQAAQEAEWDLLSSIGDIITAALDAVGITEDN
jgi:hypothetical protein